MKKLDIRLNINPEVFPEVCDYLESMVDKKARGALIIRVFHDFVIMKNNPLNSKPPVVTDKVNQTSSEAYVTEKSVFSAEDFDEF